MVLKRFWIDDETVWIRIESDYELTMTWNNLVCENMIVEEINQFLIIKIN